MSVASQNEIGKWYLLSSGFNPGDFFASGSH